MKLYTKLFLALKLFIIQTSKGLQVAGKCQSSVDGIALVNHTFLTIHNQNMISCSKECKKHKECQSINYFKTSHLCQLNNRSITTKPEKRRVLKDSVYFEHLQSTVIGSHEEAPGESCKEIKTTTSYLVSGFYWLKHPVTNMVSQIYCNMKTGEADGCTTSPCKNQGTCNNVKHGDYSCTCTAAFKGVHCEAPVIIGTECSSYSNISDSTRGINHGLHPKKCDRSLATKWYRFVGPAGVRLPTSYPPRYRCSTDATGWLNGVHPTVREGIENRTVCFHWSTNICNWRVVIRVRNCGPYFVYELKQTPSCSLRYCVTN